jgi:hypothetical protein
MPTGQNHAVNHERWSMMPYEEERQGSVVKAVADTKKQISRDARPNLQIHRMISGALITASANSHAKKWNRTEKSARKARVAMKKESTGFRPLLDLKG